jgi:hypothetical protein
MKKLKLPYNVELALAKRYANIYTQLFRECKNIKTGEILFNRKILGHSFNANFLQLLYASFRGFNTFAPFLASSAPYVNNATIFDITGAFFTPGNSDENLVNLVPPDSGGIILSNDVTVIPNKLEFITLGKIAHGVGGGQIQYLTHASNGLQFSGNTVNLDITRVFMNTSGGGIVIKKIYVTPNNAVPFNVFIEAIASPFDTVPNTFSYTVTIRFSTTT